MSQTNGTTEKERLQHQLKEIELRLQMLQQQFIDISVRTRASVSASRKRSDAKRIDALRKQLGLS